MYLLDTAIKTIAFKQFNLTKGKRVKNTPTYTLFSLDPLTLSLYLGLFLPKILYQPLFTTAMKHLHSNLDNWSCPELQKDKIFQNFNNFNKHLNRLALIQQIKKGTFFIKTVQQFWSWLVNHNHSTNNDMWERHATSSKCFGTYRFRCMDGVNRCSFIQFKKLH